MDDGGAESESSPLEADEISVSDDSSISLNMEEEFHHEHLTLVISIPRETAGTDVNCFH
jgi:hypothetical protein